MSPDPKMTRAGLYGQIDEVFSPASGFSRTEQSVVANTLLRNRIADLKTMHETGLPDSIARRMYDQGRRDVAGVVEEIKTKVALEPEVSYGIADLDHDGLMSQQLGAEAIEQYGKAPAQREAARAAAGAQIAQVEDELEPPEGWGQLTDEAKDEMAAVYESKPSRVDFSKEVDTSWEGEPALLAEPSPKVIAQPNPAGVQRAQQRSPKPVGEVLRDLKLRSFADEGREGRDPQLG